MVEVFKTDVACPDLAARVLDRIHRQFNQYRGNFDLEDCDRVLRILAPSKINSCELLDVLLEMGVNAEILRDEVPTIESALAADIESAG